MYKRVEWIWLCKEVNFIAMAISPALASAAPGGFSSGSYPPERASTSPITHMAYGQVRPTYPCE